MIFGKGLKHVHKLFGSLGYRNAFVVGYHHLTGRKLFSQIQDKKIFIIGRDAEIRYKGNAKTNSGQIDEQVIAGKLDLRSQV